ncbi:MAG: beta-galactosidase trimerization domain-containing protein, partial [bacterium]
MNTIRRHFIAATACLLAFFSWHQPALAIDLDMGLNEKTDEEDVTKWLGEEVKRDFDRMGGVHLSLLADWDAVQHHASPVPTSTNAPCHWKETLDGIVSPLDSGGISTLIAVPEAASYRIFLRHQLDARTPRPVTLTLIPQKAGAPLAGTNAAPQRYEAAGTGLLHRFGQKPLNGALTGKQQEKTLPLRFESETQLIAAPSAAMLVWEYWDVALTQGVYRATLSDADNGARAHSLFLTRSRDFRPSFSSVLQDRTLNRLYMRFRPLTAGITTRKPFTVSAQLGYHWQGRHPPGGTEDCWSWPIGTIPATAPGEWSPFIEATDAVVPGPGPWSTCNLYFTGVTAGEMDIQFAWFPHAQAVERTLRTGVGEDGHAMLRIPNGLWPVKPRAGVPAWGMWDPALLDLILSQEAVIARYFAWADQAAERLQLKPDHPRLQYIRLFSSCRVPMANRVRAAGMLAKLGINWIDGAPASVVKQFGLHDELCAYNQSSPLGVARGMSDADRKRVTKIKIGDEISTLTSPEVINQNAAKRSDFQSYLAEQARLEGLDLPSFMGVQNMDEIDCIGALSANPGRFERRLFYHSQRFGHITTCDDYAALVRNFEQLLPNARIYNNYSPHPVFLTGTTMNHSDWFVLPRHQAQTLGWAEDWATGGSWGLGTAYQCTSFFAALLDCAVRKHGYPSGFYVGSNCGGSAQKIFGCVAEGLTWLHLYDWGPLDSWAEGSNAWSDNQSEYYAVLCAAAALGPADTIIGKGRREPRRTAILYNRSHEIMSAGAGRLNHDWMWTFIALKSAQIPVDVIIEEDLTDDGLKRYDCIVLGGFNLAGRDLAALRRWVEAGGLLVGNGGAAVRDIYNDPLSGTVELFGARQRQAGADKAGSVALVTFPASAWFSAATLTNRAGVTFILEPTTATPLATYGGGGCAATVRALGKGHALLLGFQPGYAFRDSDKTAG